MSRTFYELLHVALPIYAGKDAVRRSLLLLNGGHFFLRLFRAPVERGLVKERLAHAQQRRDQENADEGGDDRAAREHHADRADQVDGRNKGDSQRGAEKHQRARDDRSVRGCAGDERRLMAVLAGA